MSIQKNQPPLASRLRPCVLSEFVGQQHLLSTGKPLALAITRGELHSLLFWGPPGCGKTTLAHLLALHVTAEFITISAIDATAKEIRGLIAQAKAHFVEGNQTVLFIDEIHRFNKAQQDLFLPSVEAGHLVLIGATTENPAFSLNNALLSRLQVYKLQPLSVSEQEAVIVRALSDVERGLGSYGLRCEVQAQQRLVHASGGDIRRLLNYLEKCAQPLLEDIDQAGASGLADELRIISDDLVTHALADQQFIAFDNQGDHFYDQISALHKSVRGSDTQAALYWMARLLEGGCDPLYIARRVVRIASEDIGNADPQALQVSLNAWEVQERLGSPEGELAIAQAIAYLALAPKSNAVYLAYKAARNVAASSQALPVPLHLRNAPAAVLKSLGHGGDYRYAHDYDHGYVPGECYLPLELSGQVFYKPVNRGFERQLCQRLDWFHKCDEDSLWKRSF